jgi:hypothetical protein
VLEREMRAIVEACTERRVVAFMSSSHKNADLMAELVLLEPEDPDGSAQHPAGSTLQPDAETAPGS